MHTDLQMNSDERLIQRCLSNQWLNEEQATILREELNQNSKRGKPVPLAKLLLDMKLLNPSQALMIRADLEQQVVINIGPYEVHERLGAGGMGEVFRAIDADGVSVALKVLSDLQRGDPEAEERFRREWKIGQKINHPHVVRIKNAGKEGECRWLAMELVPGKTLRERIKEAQLLTENEAITLLTQLACAMREISRLNIMHRDIKPANIILAPPRSGVNEPFCAKLCDFGLGKARAVKNSTKDESLFMQLTIDGMVLGTPHYMSPEQAIGMVELDQRSDIYALGASVYSGLTGTTIHGGRSAQAILWKLVHEDLDLSALDKTACSKELKRLLTQMLHKEREKRLHDWDWVLNGLHMVNPELVSAIEGPSSKSLPVTTLHNKKAFRQVKSGIIPALVFAAFAAVIFWIIFF